MLEEVQRKLEQIGDDRFADGRLAEACSQAEHSLFNVLMTAQVYGVSEISEADLLPERSSS